MKMFFRSEKSSPVDKEGFQRHYDGIIRSSPPLTRWDIGFVEVKSYEKKIDLDRVKIIDVLKNSLDYMSKVIRPQDKMREAVVFGICCHGMSTSIFMFFGIFLMLNLLFVLGVEMTIIRACKAWDQIYLCDEFKCDYNKEADSIFDFLEFCWSLKVSDYFF